MENKTLYIIGNGFDLHHGYKTSYLDFKKFIEQENFSLFLKLHKYVFLEDVDLWWEFESRLSKLNLGNLLGDIMNTLPSYFDDNLGYMHYSIYTKYVYQNIDLLTVSLFSYFRNFIKLSTFKERNNNHKISLDKNAVFLNFNMTNSLEKLYNINQNQITYIHNSAFNEDNIILGHSVQTIEDALDDNDKAKKAKGKSSTDEKLNSDELLYNYGMEDFKIYYSSTFKPTDKIIERHQSFFKSLKSVENIYVLGHSLSEVDLPYFKKIFENIKSNIDWTVSYYNKSDTERLKRTLTSIGVKQDNINFITLDGLHII